LFPAQASFHLCLLISAVFFIVRASLKKISLRKQNGEHRFWTLLLSNVFEEKSL